MSRTLHTPTRSDTTEKILQRQRQEAERVAAMTLDGIVQRRLKQRPSTKSDARIIEYEEVNDYDEDGQDPNDEYYDPWLARDIRRKKK